MNEDTLQENSIIYLSGGFDGPFVLQAFSVRKLPLPAVGLQMCLTDGKVYIGAKYNNADYPEVQDYWLLEITAKFNGQNQPMYFLIYPAQLKLCKWCRRTLENYSDLPPAHSWTISTNKQIEPMKIDWVNPPRKLSIAICFSPHFWKILILKNPLKNRNLLRILIRSLPVSTKENKNPSPNPNPRKKLMKKDLK